jgi:serine acetyltransferase
MKFMTYVELLRQDFARNRRNTKGLIILTLFRTCSYLRQNRRNPLLFLVGVPAIVFYKFFVEYLLSVGLPPAVSADGGMVIYHGQGLVVHEKTRIGKNVTLRHNTTIGSKTLGDDGGAPLIGDDVNIGANSVLLGEIKIGRGAVVGAGSVILKDIPDGSVVAGNPAVIIKGAAASTESR